MDPWFTDDERAALMDNSRRSLAGEETDPVPPALIYQPDGRGRWLITEIAEDGDTAWGLCDAGIGLPETGEVSLSALATGNGPAGMRPERCKRYRPSPDLPLSRLDRMAFEAGRIVA